MSYEAKLRTAIARAIAAIEDEQSLAQACVRFGLEDGGPVDFWENKKQYVEDRLTDQSLTALIAISEVLLCTYESHKLHVFRLNEALRLARAGGKRRISEITRRNIFDALLLLGALEGQLDLDNFFRRIWPIDEMPSDDPRHKTFSGDLWQHMVINDDWSQHELLSRLDAMELSDEVFGVAGTIGSSHRPSRKPTSTMAGSYQQAFGTRWIHPDGD